MISTAISYLKIFKTNSVIGVVAQESKFYKNTGNGMELLYNPDSKLKLESDIIYRKIPGFILFTFAAYKNNSWNNIKTGHIIFNKKSSLTIQNDDDKYYIKYLLENEII
jgi:hypothetical protein